MGSRGRGGYQAPAAPAAVSGPGALSARTDGGPGQKITPTLSNRPGGQQGDRQASIEQQRMAPLRQGGVAAPAPPAGGGMADPATAEAPPLGVDPFGPTDRPWEPVTAGAQLGPGAAPDPRQNLRDVLGAWYQQHGDADGVLALIENLDAEAGG